MFSKYTILTHVLDGYRTTCVPGGRMQNSGGETTVTAAFVKRCADSAHVPNSTPTSAARRADGLEMTSR
jgi:hypothetical protein